MADGHDCDGTGELEVAPLAERLAKQFYEWEQRGRGWLLWERAVRLEPPFEPFVGYRAPAVVARDDGRRETWLSGFVRWLSRKLAGAPKRPPPQNDTHDEAEVVDDIALAEQPVEIIELQVVLPVEAKSTTDATARFLLGLSSCRAPVSFEVVGSVDEVTIQFACSVADVDHVRAQLQAHYPDAVVTVAEREFADRWNAGDDDATHSAVIEFGLSHEFVLSLATGPADGLIALAGVLELVEEGEQALLQVLFEPVRHPWSASVLRAVATPGGDAVFGGAVDMLAAAKAKLGTPLFAAVIRVASRAATRERAWSLVRRLGHGFDSLADPMGNELIALANDGYDAVEHARDVAARRCRRSGVILNLDELSALVHLPTADVRSAKVKRRGQRTKPAPACVLHHELVLGRNEHAGRVREVTLDAEQRVRHMHVVGASGTGKSTFLLNLILQDIARGQGVAVLDPHGDLIDAILDRIPEHRLADVVLFDPSDEEHPIGFNVLAAHSEAEKTLMASDLVGIFRRLSTSWGDQMNAVLANAILAFLESDRGGTLADLRRFLIERPFREEFLRTVRDPHIAYYWRKEFPLLVGRSQGPVLTRLDTFLRPKALRHIVAQRENRLDFADIMDVGKIFLARLAHGAIGEENTYLLGSLLVSKFHQIALGRQQVKEEQRRHFWLYVDEFHHFATPSMASLLAGVRKYRLGLVLAHQEMHQLEGRSPDVASAILANSYTRVCFRVGDHDARKLKDGFSTFGAGDLQNLGTGEAVCRVERSEFEFNLRTVPLDPVQDRDKAALARERIVALSRERYAADRAVVEAQLRESAESFAIEEPAPRSNRAKPKQDPPPQSAQVVVAQPPAIVASAEPTPAVTSQTVQVPKVPAVEKSVGRGGAEHKYLQQLIKQWADGMGYRSTIEREILDGAGSIDVALEKLGVAIACQVSVTTSCEWELANARKALRAGFAPVFLISAQDKHLAMLRKRMEAALGDDERAKVFFFAPEAAFSHLQAMEISKLTQEQTVRGYKVKRSFKAVDAADGQDRRQAVSRVVAEGIKRSRSGK